MFAIHPLLNRRLGVVLVAALICACAEQNKKTVEPGDIEATWDSATIHVYDTNKPVPLHTAFPFVAFSALVRNGLEESVSFFLSGNNLGNGWIIGNNSDDPGRFLLIGPDTTLSLYARELYYHYDMSWFSVAPGDSIELMLFTDNMWIFPSPNSGAGSASFVATDSSSLANFFQKAVDHGRLVYVTEANPRDTLDIKRVPEAVVRVESVL